MSDLSIFEKSQEIRFETRQYANTRERVANVLDDINDTKANKKEMATAIQAVLDELGITEQELYDYIARIESELDLNISKKMDKPFWAGFEQPYFVVSSNGGSNLRPITLSANQLPYWTGNTFYNSNIYTAGSGNIGIGTSTPTERFEVIGNIKANAIYLPVNSTSPVAYRFRSDGFFLYYTNGNNDENKLAYDNQFYKSIIGNTILDDSFHNCIVQITANCTITVPNTLRADFNCVFDAIGTIIATFVEGSDTAILAPFGKILRDNAMCTLYKYSANTYRINGGLLPV